MHYHQPTLSKWHNIISIIWQLCLDIWKQIRVRTHGCQNDGEKTVFTCRKCLLRYHISMYFCTSKYLPAPSFQDKLKKEGDNGAHLRVIICQLQWKTLHICVCFLTDHLAEKNMKKTAKDWLRDQVSRARLDVPLKLKTLPSSIITCYGCKTKIEMWKYG